MSNSKSVYTGGGDYREINTAGGKYVENTGTYYENFNQSQSLTEVATEIQKLLEQLSQTDPTNTTTEKMEIAIKTIEQIESDSTLTQRILSAAKAGGVSALESFLNHPAASFVISALEDWQQTKHRGN